MNHFAENIQVLRVAKGLKQVDIERLTGIKRSTWNNYESSYSEPKIDIILVISQFFDVTVDDLLNKDLKNVEIIYKNGTVENTQECKDNCIDNGKGNSEKEPYKYHFSDEKNSVLAEERPPFYANQPVKESEVIAALREVIKTKDSLIDALNTTLAVLKDQINAQKK